MPELGMHRVHLKMTTLRLWELLRLLDNNARRS